MASYGRPPKHPNSKKKAAKPAAKGDGEKMDAKANPFAAFLAKRKAQGGKSKGGSAAALRERAAKLRARAKKRSAAHEMS